MLLTSLCVLDELFWQSSEGGSGGKSNLFSAEFRHPEKRFITAPMRANNPIVNLPLTALGLKLHDYTGHTCWS